MSTISSVTVWRRMLFLTIAAIIAALAITVSAPPQDAHAIMNPTTVTQSYEGWGYTRTRSCLAMHCGDPYVAWRWTRSGWWQSSIGQGQQVYIYPYASGWHWIWTQRTGWLAIQSSHLDNGYRCYGPTCPVF